VFLRERRGQSFEVPAVTATGGSTRDADSHLARAMAAPASYLADWPPPTAYVLGLDLSDVDGRRLM
jgi:hypothetical protein